MIKKESKMNLAQLGNTDAAQNTYIHYYLTQALWKYAGLISRKKTSDALVVASDGYVTFQVSGADIEDMYAPIRIMVNSEAGTTFRKRTSFDAPNGWFKETANDPIHIKGAGTYVLQYKAYHPKITSETQALEIPQTSYDLIQYETLGKIKESLNDVEGTAAAYAVADKLIPILVKANMDSSMSTTGGMVPSQNEVQYYRRG
ncbi:MAG: hypothetical protein K0Q73_8865 [Paenibacillus sp.]|nr:hypothetical protein [Paenibacillus sp.]